MQRKSNGEEEENEKLSERTIKQIDDLLQHAQEIFKEGYDSALRQYKDPDKRHAVKKKV
jgi:cation transport regulator ChaB